MYFSKISKSILFFFCVFNFFLINAQNSIYSDSLKIINLYEGARQNSDKNPIKAKEILYDLVKFTDSISTKHTVSEKFLAERKSTALHFLSYFERRESNFEKSLELAQRSIEIKEANDFHQLLATTYHQKAKTWHNLNLNSEVLKALDKADSIAKQYNQKDELLEIYSSYGSYYGYLGDTINAKKYYRASIKLVEDIGNHHQEAIVYSNYANYLHRTGHYHESLPYLEKSLQLHIDNDNDIGLESALYALGIHYNKVEKPEKAIYYLKQAINLNIKLNGEATLPFRYKALSYSYELLEDYKNAYQYHKLYKEALAKRNDAEEIKRVAFLEKDFQAEKRRVIDSTAFIQQKLLDESNLKRKANTRFWVFVVFITIIIGVIVFLLGRNRQKIKEQAYQNILLNNKIAVKTEEINELLTETIQHIRSKEHLAENLQKLSLEQEGITLKSIIADLKASKADHSKLMLIKQNIKQVNFEFIKKLKTKHPILTKTDIEICSFIRIGLSRKEIANLRNTSLEAVKSSRFRIKKKLKISASEKLDDYVNSL